ncbi:MULTISPECIES: TetR/AcrR family transcriptional regulator [Pseudomonadota]|jgi:TetR/AcrR family transcriptional regulator|uniref:TetR/AcrR family transcriptional regulator n=1 Tax=Pseudomonadota TaxID=1224 RepID=UPI000BC49018|nr:MULTISPECIES: TetR/AcrR family transcriptional regulator [Pseudomonadota]OYY39357.1 MAG: TetR family transcriptional regulator [Polaromonas sp. 35-63-35]OYZ20456.1 MAG: TetR family transcriptional regulator [Polaromonas sp. 16-63-31]OYZ80725.1 MAG: TetR family transcriptional regulator [Polaromonas sp. 24-63-21]OZA51724.1 MAG: TetR family transcriptional regulator [Polaromonas sp. 17-63-33]OZA89810.1 MAG: TetR family transcriptional regulator [Polaromonas sp. 39-63-25]
MSVWKDAVPVASAQFDRKREVLLREAAACFNRRGYHGTSLTEIAKKLGVTKAALYTYVPSKEDLLYYCHDAAMDSALESLHKAASAGTGLQRLTLTLRHYLEMMLGAEGGYVVLLEENAMKPEHMRAIVKRRDRFEQGLRQFVIEGIADGSIVRCNPKLAVFVMMGALNWGRKWYRANGSWSGAQIAHAMTEMLERSVSSTPSPVLLEDPAAVDDAEAIKPEEFPKGRPLA